MVKLRGFFCRGADFVVWTVRRMGDIRAWTADPTYAELRVLGVLGGF